MSYKGNVAIIPTGVGGLTTDDPQPLIPTTDLIVANNVILQNNKIEKDKGSRKLNTDAISGGIAAHVDWWPNTVDQRIVAVGKDNKIYRATPPFSSFSEVTSTTQPTVSASPDLSMVTGGQELAGNDKKLFILTGGSPIQVISDDETTRSDISKPASDWSGSNHPYFGIIHRGRLGVLGNANDPHRFAFSSATDHEDFTTSPLQFSVYPGDGERLISGFIFKGNLYLLKFPEGLYVLEDSDSNTSNWYFREIDGSFGGASVSCSVKALDDQLICNNYGTISSLVATQTLGDIKSADLFLLTKTEEFVREELSRLGNFERRIMYYAQRKQAFVSYRSSDSLNNNRICIIDFSKQTPRITWSDKDQPNYFALIKDQFGVPGPSYCADDGFVYLMDQVDRDVGGNAYKGEFQTPHMDFTQGDTAKSEREKQFDFLEVIYEPTGKWNLDVDVFIDTKFIRTLSFSLDGGSELDSMRFDQGKMDAGAPFSTRKSIDASGRRISLKASNPTVGQNFKIVQFRIYYNILGNEQTKR